MTDKKDGRPDEIKQELDSIKCESFYFIFRMGGCDQIGTNAHTDVQNRPYNWEEPAWWRQWRLNDFFIQIHGITGEKSTDSSDSKRDSKTNDERFPLDSGIHEIPPLISF